MRVVELSWEPSGLGPVATGVADEGTVRLDDELELRDVAGTPRRVRVRGIKAARLGGPAESTALVLHLLLGDDLEEGDVEVGQVLSALPPGGASGVREPRRPHPTTPSSATATVVPPPCSS